jgi:3-oxoacyl-[acyl-carrier protein] reductase/2-hydroxycyclohexanecarboxyl-CoA dehydrogenase
MGRLGGRGAAVTGASQGIGRAIARALASNGADVVAADMNLEGATAVVQEIEQNGGRALAVKADVSRRSEAENIIDQTVAAFGRIDILVNNAGINRDAMLHKMSDEDWDRVIAVDLTGVFYCTRAAARIMRDQNYGRIINISSLSSRGNVGQANYAAAKAGVIGLTKTAAKELATRGITVNAICPGFIDTEMTRAVPEKIRPLIIDKIPAGEPGKPEDVAHMVSFLASDEAQYVTGTVIDVAGGMVL